MKPRVIDCRAVGKVHGHGANGVTALSGIDMSIAAGEIVVLTGPSGSGKSTLLTLLGLLDVPSSGDIALFGTPAPHEQKAREAVRRKRLGFIFQSFNLVATLNARENVELALSFNEPARARRRDRAEAALAAVGLGSHGERRPDQLSGGQQQRVAIARALVREPGLILADEPTANLDRSAADGVLNLLIQVPRRNGGAVLISSHDPRVIAVADRVLTLDDGRLCTSSELQGRKAAE